MHNCAPCAKVTPVFEEIAAKYTDNARQFGEYFIDFVQDKDWVVEQLQVRSTPTFLVFDKNADVTYRLRSAKGIEELEEYVKVLI